MKYAVEMGSGAMIYIQTLIIKVERFRSINGSGGYAESMVIP
jgi:hypothetical protein